MDAQYLKNTLLIYIDKVVRLEGEYEGKEDDYFICDTGNGIIHISQLVLLTPLKPHLPKYEYEELVRLWNLNNEIKAI